ncbi:Chloroplast J-like domain 1 [Quillaja saponaria]|uniref:Chloroplast J-like domain 1 n=1 Tax=Quillaja saponaria TaxID=32244 RepID=A0AAD7VFA9_QUISA|nr:Chloroplast J-like domain 1 [Quillaja saponaria]
MHFTAQSLQFSHKNFRPRLSNSSSSFARFSRTTRRNYRRVICAAASAAGSPNFDSSWVSPIEGFDMIKAAYTKKRKEAERNGDEAIAARLEKAYDKVMMAQLTNRKKGVTFGSLKVSKDVKYADKQPIVPWGPSLETITKSGFAMWWQTGRGDYFYQLIRPLDKLFSKSSKKDMRINLGISAAFTAWIVIKRSAEYKPLQFLAFTFVYRLFEKLKSFEPPESPSYTEDGEDTGQGLRLCKTAASFTGLNFFS